MECGKPFSRRLYAWEIEQARLVFADSLRYDAIRIHECSAWPNSIDRLGASLKARFAAVPAEKKKTNNAITVGNHCYFPVRLPEQFIPPGEKDHYMIGWLIHELTHAWQYQQMGWRYLFLALQAQFRQGYDYGGEAKLQVLRSEGKTLFDFNLEQQGDICRDYYFRVCAAKNTEAFQAYVIGDIQRRA